MHTRSTFFPAFAFLGGLAVVGAVGGAALTACSSSSGGGSSGAAEDGGGKEGGGGGDSGAAADSSGPEAVNACATFVDRSDVSASRTIAWGFPVSTAPERCMTIKKGQDVTFNGNFGTHPLLGSGGDSPNPLSSPDATGKVSFAKAGTFGFVCGNHPSMTGAIKVVE